MTDLRPRLDAALHDLDRLESALPRAWVDGWSPVRAIDPGRVRVRGGGDAPMPHAAEDIALEGYRLAAQRLARAHDALRDIGWPTVWAHHGIVTDGGRDLTHRRQPQRRLLHGDGSHCRDEWCGDEHWEQWLPPMRMPEPTELTTPIAILRSALKVLAAQEAWRDTGGIKRVCDLVEGALRAIPVGIRQPAKQAAGDKPKGKPCANPTCKGNVAPSQTSAWCQACRKHQTRWQTPRILGRDGVCVCTPCTRRRAS